MRELEVVHPAAKSIVELARAQDEEVGDGTTSVIILGIKLVLCVFICCLNVKSFLSAGEILHSAQPWLLKNLHPKFIVAAFQQALEDSLSHLKTLAFQLDLQNRDNLLTLLRSTLGTKFARGHMDLFCNIALDAVSSVVRDNNGQREVDIKRYVKIEKIPGGDLNESCVVPGVVINKGTSCFVQRIECETGNLSDSGRCHSHWYEKKN